MSNGSPTAYLLWAILSSLFSGFLVCHLWSYDKFQCLRWNAGRQPGAFKRFMTYTYVAIMPLLLLYSVAMTILKYREGYFVLLDGRILPKPTLLWKEQHQDWLLPLNFVVSGVWALEITTHLEELTFWLFMLHQGPIKRDWFGSWEVRVWYLGSMVAVLGMPLTTMITRNETIQCEAWIFLVGSSAALATTICFLYILARFPSFVRHVKEEGAEPEVVIRLTAFYNLNVVRVLFRFLFALPLFILGIDGVQGQHLVNINPFACDFLLTLGGIGCFVSSAITLLIFFPRSITQEAGYAPRSPRMAEKIPMSSSHIPSYPLSGDNSFHQRYLQPSSQAGTPGMQPSPRMATFQYPLPSDDAQEAIPDYELGDPAAQPRHSADDTCDSHDMIQDMPDSESSHAHQRYPNFGSSKHPRPSESYAYPDLHPYVMTFTSPIDLFDASNNSNRHRRGSV